MPYKVCVLHNLFFSDQCQYQRQSLNTILQPINLRQLRQRQEQNKTFQTQTKPLQSLQRLPKLLQKRQRLLERNQARLVDRSV